MKLLKIEHILTLIGILIALGAWFYPYTSVENTKVDLETGVAAPDMLKEEKNMKSTSKTASISTMSSVSQTAAHPQSELKQSGDAVINIYGDQIIDGDFILGDKITTKTEQ